MEREEKKTNLVLFTLLGVMVGIVMGSLVTYYECLNNSATKGEGLVCPSEEEISKETLKENKNSKATYVLVIPEKKEVEKGDVYKAEIIFFEMDTTLKYKCVINGRELEDHTYQFNCGSVGSFTYHGEVQYYDRDSSLYVIPFMSDYTVKDASVSIITSFLAADKYNPVTIDVGHNAYSDVDIKVQNAECKKNGDVYLIKPNAGAKNCTLDVMVRKETGWRSIAKKEFQVIK